MKIKENDNVKNPKKPAKLSKTMKNKKKYLKKDQVTKKDENAVAVKADTKEFDKKLTKIEKGKAKKLKKKLKLNENMELKKEQSGTSQASGQEVSTKKDNANKLAKKSKSKLYKEFKKAKLAKIQASSEENKEEEKSANRADIRKELDEKELEKIEKKKSKKLMKKVKLEEAKEKGKSKIIEDGVEDGKKRKVIHPQCTVFVGNLPVRTKRVQIVRLFSKYGLYTKAIRLRTGCGQVIFKHKQRKEASSLNAYVVFEDVESAKNALELNGVKFKNNTLRVTPTDKESITDTKNTKRTVVVGNLKVSANEKKLREIFSSCGEIEYIRCIGNGENGCSGVAFVCFKSIESIGLALELNETLLDERPIRVKRYSTKKLGAKKLRENQESSPKKPKATGAKKRINEKQKKNGLIEKSMEKKKKSDFHGTKVTGIKKPKNTKKPNNEMKGLAKKIAPKIIKGSKTIKAGDK